MARGGDVVTGRRRGAPPERCAPPHGPGGGRVRRPEGDVVPAEGLCWAGFPNGWWHLVSGDLGGDGHGKSSLGASGDLTVVGVEEEWLLALPHTHALGLLRNTLGGLQVRDLSLELLFPLGQLSVL